MKRTAVALVLGCMVVTLAGCGTAPMATVVPKPTATPTPVMIDPLPTYTSDALGLEITMPHSWAGKYRVVEGEGCLTFYFNPTQAPDPNVGDGELFRIVYTTSGLDMTKYDTKELKLFMGTFIWCEPKDVRYQPSQPEYDTYVALRKNVPGIYYSVTMTPCKTYNTVYSNTVYSERPY